MTEPAYDQPQEVVNIEVEQMLLGALLSFNDAYGKVAGRVRAEDFSDPFNADLYRLISRAIEDGKPATPQFLDDVMGDQVPDGYLSRLQSSALTISDVTFHADYIRRLAQVRSAREFCNAGLAELTGEHRLDEFVEEAFGVLDAIRDDGVTRSPTVAIGQAANSVIDRAVDIRERRNNGDPLPITKTGLTDLDKQIGGMRGGQLIVVAGAPASGKSALALSIAYNVADEAPGTDQQRHCLVKSLEMSSGELTERALARASGIPTPRIEQGYLSEDEITSLRQAESYFSRMPLYFDDNAGATVGDVRLSALQTRRKHGLDLIVVDYLQLMSGFGENRTLEISSVTRGLKQLAKELDVPIIALSQLSRAVNNRESKRPMLSDLRESGSIEQDADIVLFVHNQAYWDAMSEPRKGTHEHDEWQADLLVAERHCEIIVGKQRQGAAGKTVMVAFDRQTVTMSDFSQQEEMGI